MREYTYVCICTRALLVMMKGREGRGRQGRGVNAGPSTHMWNSFLGLVQMLQYQQYEFKYRSKLLA